MKKFLAVLMVLMLAVGSVAFAEITDFTGEWYASMYGMPITLTVNADGTCRMDFAGEGAEGPWVVEDGIFYINKGESDETKLTVGENSMAAVSDEMSLEFTREPVETIALPAPVAAEDISAFNGTWNAGYICLAGMTLDWASAKAEMGEMLGDVETDTAVIDNGKVALLGQEAIELPFVDGHLYKASDAEGVDVSITVDLCDDGSIACTVPNVFIGSFTIYFTRAE